MYAVASLIMLALAGVRLASLFRPNFSVPNPTKKAETKGNKGFLQLKFATYKLLVNYGAMNCSKHTNIIETSTYKPFTYRTQINHDFLLGQQL